MLYLIGLGLGDEKDLTINARETIKKCDVVYLENYTSYLNINLKKLEKLAGKTIIVSDRNFVEVESQILENAKNNNVAFLVKGDVFSATTHVDLFIRAKQAGVECKVLHNASIITAVGDTGLSLYKFGRVVSIPFDNDLIDSPYETFLANNGMHTLFLLDLRPNENRYMNFKQAINYLLKKSSDRNDGKISLENNCVVCVGIGTDKQVVKYGKIRDLLNLEIDVLPQCIIVPGELHFMEEEMLSFYKI